MPWLFCLWGKWERRLPRMVAFWNELLLERGEFHCSVFSKHLALPGLQREYFSRRLMLFAETALAVFDETTPAKVLQVAQRMAASLRAEYFISRSHTDNSRKTTSQCVTISSGA